MCQACGCGDSNVVPVSLNERILAANDRAARHNREHFRDREVRAINLMVPEQNTALIAFSNTARTDWGQISQGSGLLHDLLDAALCIGDLNAPPKPKAKRGKR